MRSVSILLAIFVLPACGVQHLQEAYLNDSPAEDPRLNLIKMLMFAQSPTRGGSRIRSHSSRTPSTRMIELDIKELDFPETWELLERVRLDAPMNHENHLEQDRPELEIPSEIQELLNKEAESFVTQTEVSEAPKITASAKVDAVMEEWFKIESAEDKAICYDKILGHLNEVFVKGTLRSMKPKPLDIDFGEGEYEEALKDAAALDSEMATIMNTEIPEELQGDRPEFLLAKDKYGQVQVITEDMKNTDPEEWEEPLWFEEFKPEGEDADAKFLEEYLAEMNLEEGPFKLKE